jgi:hypothetical protein
MRVKLMLRQQQRGKKMIEQSAMVIFLSCNKLFDVWPRKEVLSKNIGERGKNGEKRDHGQGSPQERPGYMHVLVDIRLADFGMSLLSK